MARKNKRKETRENKREINILNHIKVICPDFDAFCDSIDEEGSLVDIISVAKKVLKEAYIPAKECEICGNACQWQKNPLNLQEATFKSPAEFKTKLIEEIEIARLEIEERIAGEKAPKPPS